MQRIGYDADLRLEGAGFYPQGGGRLRATVRPAGGLRPLRLDQRGELRRIRGLSALSNLEGHVAERQRAQALRRLEDLHCPVEIEIQRMPSRFKGTLLLLLAEFGGSTACYFGLGARGKPPPNGWLMRRWMRCGRCLPARARSTSTWRINCSCPWLSPPAYLRSTRRR